MPRVLRACALPTALALAACGSPESTSRATRTGSGASASIPLASGSAATTGSGATSSSAPSPPAVPGPADHLVVARAFVEQLGRGDFTGAATRLAPEAAVTLGAAELQAAWTGALANKGTFVLVESVEPSTADERFVVHVQLSAGHLEVRLGFAPGGDVASVHVGLATASLTAPAYIEPAKFTAEEVKVGRGPSALPGTLLVPKGKGPFPAVLFVHGAGGADRDDATRGGSRPFRDLAEGLASRGIASLRWDKRTHDPAFVAALGGDPLDFGLKEEVLDDFAAALELATGMASLDSKRLFVLGHGEGGWLVPRLLERHPALAGGIGLAAFARHLADTLVPELEHLAKRDGAVDAAEQSRLEAAALEVARAHDPKLPRDTTAAALPFGLCCARYWLDLQGYDAVATAKAVPQPLLFLQGGRDYRATETADLARWRAGLAARRDVELRSYPTLNHVFVAGQGPATPAEYDERAGSVAPAVVTDLATWIAKR
ncbi:MAG: alpha/beta hydrolase [Myxococcales bacterium]|nr:alpha/beta hydrolase [Myxococcales bacterium]